MVGTVQWMRCQWLRQKSLEEVQCGDIWFLGRGPRGGYLGLFVHVLGDSESLV